jgi:hypothetical protein
MVEVWICTTMALQNLQQYGCQTGNKLRSVTLYLVDSEDNGSSRPALRPNIPPKPRISLKSDGEYCFLLLLIWGRGFGGMFGLRAGLELPLSSLSTRYNVTDLWWFHYLYRATNQ